MDHLHLEDRNIFFFCLFFVLLPYHPLHPRHLLPPPLRARMPPKETKKPASAKKSVKVAAKPAKRAAGSFSVGDEVEADYNGTWFPASVTKAGATYTVTWSSDDTKTAGLTAAQLRPLGAKKRKTSAEQTAGGKKTPAKAKAKKVTPPAEWTAFFTTLIYSDYAEELKKVEGPRGKIAQLKRERAAQIYAEMPKEARIAKGYTPMAVVAARHTLSALLDLLNDVIQRKRTPDSEGGVTAISDIADLVAESPYLPQYAEYEDFKEMRKAVEKMIKRYAPADAFIAGPAEAPIAPKTAFELYSKKHLPELTKTAKSAKEGDTLFNKTSTELKSILQSQWDALAADAPERLEFEKKAAPPAKDTPKKDTPAKAKPAKVHKIAPENIIKIVTLQGILREAEDLIRREVLEGCPEMLAFRERVVAADTAHALLKEVPGDVFTLHKAATDAEEKLRKKAPLEAVLTTPGPEVPKVTPFQYFRNIRKPELCTEGGSASHIAATISSEWKAKSKEEQKRCGILATRETARESALNAAAPAIRHLPNSATDLIKSLCSASTTAMNEPEDTPTIPLEQETKTSKPSPDAMEIEGEKEKKESIIPSIPEETKEQKDTPSDAMEVDKEGEKEEKVDPTIPSIAEKPKEQNSAMEVEKEGEKKEVAKEGSGLETQDSKVTVATEETEGRTQETTEDESSSEEEEEGLEDVAQPMSAAKTEVVRRYNEELLPAVVAAAKTSGGGLGVAAAVTKVRTFTEARLRLEQMQRHVVPNIERAVLTTEERAMKKKERERIRKTTIPKLQELRERIFTKQFASPSECTEIVSSGVQKLTEKQRSAIEEAFEGAEDWRSVLYTIRDLIDEQEGNAHQERAPKSVAHQEYIAAQVGLLRGKRVGKYPDEAVMSLPPLPAPQLIAPHKQPYFGDIVQCFTFLHVFAKLATYGF